MRTGVRASSRSTSRSTPRSGRPRSAASRPTTSADSAESIGENADDRRARSSSTGVELPYRPGGRHGLPRDASRSSASRPPGRWRSVLHAARGARGGAAATHRTTKWKIDEQVLRLGRRSRSATRPYNVHLGGCKYFPINSGSPAIAATGDARPGGIGRRADPRGGDPAHDEPGRLASRTQQVITEAFKKLKFVVVLSPWLSETADLFADVVLPAATIEKYEGPNSRHRPVHRRRHAPRRRRWSRCSSPGVSSTSTSTSARRLGRPASAKAASSPTLNEELRARGQARAPARREARRPARSSTAWAKGHRASRRGSRTSRRAAT